MARIGRVFDSTRFSQTIRCMAHMGVAASFLSVLIVAGGCQQKEQAGPPPVPVVEVVKVVQQDVPIFSEWIGVLDGSINAVIRPQVTGYLVKQNYVEGDIVRKGQVLFEIDPRTFQAEVKQAQAALEQAKGELAAQEASAATARADLARIKPLAAKNAVSQKDLDYAIGRDLVTKAAVVTAKAGIAVAQANLEKAQLELGFTRITSPVDGVAGIAKAQLGNLVSPSMQEELTSVSALDPIKAYINVSEQEYLRARTAENRATDAPLQLVLADGSVYPHQGRMALADRQVDPATGTLKIGTVFANPENLLRPGMFGKVRAVLQTKSGALIVPQRAVTEMQGRYLVAVVAADNKVDVRPVQVGQKIDSGWVIEKGLNPGEAVVAEGTQKVRPGMSVTPKPFEPAAPAPASKG
ncbi:MAG: efflux RND transporter periplasmic adaptor subunit [Desulfovibrionales bacterium]|nr:efflux RND transporter periplasmic adaptor subunit [Desulfovibrionales bacterium]